MDYVTSFIARWLALLPGWMVRTASSQAKSIRNDWFASNSTARSYKRGPVRRFLVFSSSHPAWFTLLVALVAGSAARIATRPWVGSLGLVLPKLKDDFDLPAFIGVPWATQATLVALVYPIVIAFIALMLQRRAHSTAALRLYALDCAVIPASASSLGLLAVLTIEYFGAIPAAKHRDDLMLGLLVLDATWFLLNLALTAYFLVRTVRFLQDDEQRLTFKKLAIDVVLRQELVASVIQHLVAGAPEREWGQPEQGSRDKPSIQMVMWDEQAKTQVEQRIDADQVVADVNLRLLHWVAKAWLKRTKAFPVASNTRPPVLMFRRAATSDETGVVKLCAVLNGPSLRAWERAAVRCAYVFRRRQDIAFGLSTEKMLNELAVECQNHVEEARYDAAEEVFREQLDLHKALLNACSFDAGGVPDNAALTQSSVRWFGDLSFQWRWLLQYHELARTAVNLLDKDARLFRLIARVPASITYSLPTRPANLVSETQLVATHLAYEMSAWWIRQAQTASGTGIAPFTGYLPAPYDRLYDSTLASFIGAWDNVRVQLEPAHTKTDEQHWLDMGAAATVYADHIDRSAKLFLDAMARGDAAASEWFCDHLLKWWGIFESELSTNGTEHEPDFDLLDFSVASMTWDEFRYSLPSDRYAPTAKVAQDVINLGLRRYWESMRVLVILLCLKNAEGKPSDSRELKMAHTLVAGTRLKAGADVEADRLDELDSALTRLLSIRFGTRKTERRLDGFCQSMRWETNTPQVAGWMYSWSGGITSVDSLTPQQAQLLCAVGSVGRTRRVSISRSKLNVERLWRDLDELSAVDTFLSQIRRFTLSAEFTKAEPIVTELRKLLGRDGSTNRARLATSEACRALSKVVKHERLMTLRAMDVNSAAIKRFATQISRAAFGGAVQSKLRATVVYDPSLAAPEYARAFWGEKRRLTDGTVDPLTEDSAKHFGKDVRLHADAWALAEYLSRAGIKPVGESGLQLVSGATAEMQAFVSDVAKACTAIRDAGNEPVVLVNAGTLSGALRAYQWLPFRGRTLPPDIVLRDGDPNAGDAASTYINDTPIREINTPNGDCYVVSAGAIAQFRVLASGDESAVTATWRPHDEERVVITVKWNAQLG